MRFAIAQNAVNAIIADLNDREGIGLDGVDDEIRAQIRSAWIQIVMNALMECPFCHKPRLVSPRCNVCDNDD